MTWIAWFAWFVLQSRAEPPAAPPSPPGATEQAVQGMRAVIEGQLGAFARDDAAAAWKHVSPGLQQKFGTAERFLEMVRAHYQPVYAPQAVEYGELQRVEGDWGQWLEVVGPDGGRWRALYLLQQQPDGTWRTNGCLLVEGQPAPSRA